MSNYLKHENQLIVWPILKENNLFHGSIGLNARYDMTNKELLDACLAAWKVGNDKNYRLFLIRGKGKIEISLEGNVREAGLRNGDYLEILEA
jgi:hypothetical protein